MHQNLTTARNLLEEGNFTCVLVRNEACLTATERGVKPLLSWLEQGQDLRDFSAADRVVGRATAFLYCLLGVKEVYARVMSHPAAEVLKAAGITVQAGQLVDGIINRQGTGPCPFEATVMDITDPQEALAAIRGKMEQMQK